MREARPTGSEPQASTRGCRRLAAPLITLALAALLFAPSVAAEPDYQAEIDIIREMLDRVLAEYAAGNSSGALALARSAYLDHYELLEPPIRPQAPEHTFEMENLFSDLRDQIKERRPYAEVETTVRKILRGLNEDERLLAGAGVAAPSFVFTASLAIIVREGLEAALLIAAIVSFLSASKRGELRKWIYYGAGAAVVASIGTWFAASALIAVSPVEREITEAVVAISAVVMLFYVSFWILQRIEHRRWMEFMRAKVWAAVTAGNMAALAAVAFMMVYREGFETVLFYQALTFFSTGLELYLVLGFVVGMFVLLAVYVAIVLLGARLPLKVFFIVTIGIASFLSVAMVGGAVHELQEADVVGSTVIAGWPVANPYLADFTGYRPTLETIAAQLALASIYAAGLFYFFWVRGRAGRRAAAKRKEKEAKPVKGAGEGAESEEELPTRDGGEAPARAPLPADGVAPAVGGSGPAVPAAE